MNNNYGVLSLKEHSKAVLKTLTVPPFYQVSLYQGLPSYTEAVRYLNDTCTVKSSPGAALIRDPLPASLVGRHGEPKLSIKPHQLQWEN